MPKVKGPEPAAVLAVLEGVKVWVVKSETRTGTDFEVFATKLSAQKAALKEALDAQDVKELPEGDVAEIRNLAKEGKYEEAFELWSEAMEGLGDRTHYIGIEEATVKG